MDNMDKQARLVEKAKRQNTKQGINLALQPAPTKLSSIFEPPKPLSIRIVDPSLRKEVERHVATDLESHGQGYDLKSIAQDITYSRQFNGDVKLPDTESRSNSYPRRRPANTEGNEIIPTPLENGIRNAHEVSADPSISPFAVGTALTSSSTDFNVGRWMPDVYARPFVSNHLIAINESPAAEVISQPMPTVNFQAYVASFSGNGFLTAQLPIFPPLPSPQYPMTISSDLQLNTYRQHFESLLSLEYEAEVRESRLYNLYRVSVGFKGPQMYSLKVPGMREGTPRVELGDVILLRQLRLDPETMLPLFMNQWLMPGHGKDQGYPAPGFTGLQHNAIVWGVSRANETIAIRMDSCIPESMFFNVVFLPKLKRIQNQQRAVVDIQQQMRLTEPNAPQADENETHRSQSSNSETFPDTDQGTNASKATEQDTDEELNDGRQDWVKRMLFPKEKHGVRQNSLPTGLLDQDWFDHQLNYEQKKAVDAIQQQNYGSIPFLISGPPGTGKTKTIVEIALRLIHDQRSTLGRQHILLCAPSDPAADTLATRLRPHLLQTELLRLNSPSRTFAEVPGELLPYCYNVNDLFSIPDFAKLMSYQIVVTTCRDAAILVEARTTNRDLHFLEQGLRSAIHGQDSKLVTTVGVHWSALLVDEAAQATEPDIGIPLTVVAPAAGNMAQKVVFVLAGDQNQLGPRTSSKHLDLEVSLLERLFNRSLYRGHPLARKQYIGGPTSRAKLPMLRPPFTNLVRNYRSHPAILAIPNALFYYDSLVPEATETNRMEDWEGWKGRRWPVLFTCNGGDDEIEQDGGGWYNVREVQKACNYAQSLVNSNLIEQRDICIMSPFRAQVNLLRRTIRAQPYGLYDVNIGPMEAFQGLESRVVIVCTTRTRSRFLEEDHARGLGMINEAKRFNVALTRAKQGLIVIGNPWTLSGDSSWTAFMGFCRRHNLWEGDTADMRPVSSDSKIHPERRNVNAWKQSEAATPPFIPRLEAALVYKEMMLENYTDATERFMTTSEDDAMWVSGLAAEEALREG
ncbi:MAG: hypothetical protein M1827_004187 [Pycnora praestabilis]|nr:MAG: hypothetical protein M1827_004187 [Pycnora praestabilis]